MTGRGSKAGIFGGIVLGLLGVLPCSAVPISATNSDPGVFDGNAAAPGIRTVSFASADLGGAANSILDVNVTIDFMKCNDPLTISTLSQPCSAGDAYAREIIFRLTSPEHTTVDLVLEDTYFPNNGSGPSPGSRITVTFDDAAPETVGGPNGTDFVSGIFRPIGSLAAFNGQGAVGTWSLEIADSAPLDPLGFASFRLDVQLVPEPATALLLALGIAGLATARRRRPGR